MYLEARHSEKMRKYYMLVEKTAIDFHQIIITPGGMTCPKTDKALKDIRAMMTEHKADVLIRESSVYMATLRGRWLYKSVKAQEQSFGTGEEEEEEILAH